jgi:DNA helicase-2/ATP-dependent DNA helicase PcrA
MPLELIDDISRGRSWLSFARSSKTLEQAAAGSLQYEYDDSAAASPRISEDGSSDRLSARRPGAKFPGKTYDSVESIEEFFRKRSEKMGGQQSRSAQASAARPQSSQSRAATQAAPPATDIVPGSYVRHAKYGRGLVLRREGTGDQTKFTVSFPGYGSKKLIEKYANLEKG